MRFWFHYNKSASRKAKKPKMTVQPNVVIAGNAGSYEIVRGMMVLHR